MLAQGIEIVEIDLKIKLMIIAFLLIGCSSKSTNELEGKYGHWKYRGSSTFKQIFQCVDPFKPHQDQSCK